MLTETRPRAAPARVAREAAERGVDSYIAIHCACLKLFAIEYPP